MVSRPRAARRTNWRAAAAGEPPDGLEGGGSRQGPGDRGGRDALFPAFAPGGGAECEGQRERVMRGAGRRACAERAGDSLEGATLREYIPGYPGSSTP